jgi:hypothetical protein
MVVLSWRARTQAEGGVVWMVCGVNW